MWNFGKRHMSGNATYEELGSAPEMRLGKMLSSQTWIKRNQASK